MHLEGQDETRRGEAGYAMAALLAALAIMGVVWLMAVPVWKQSVQREKEAELIWRAGQYARAVALYQRKYANAFPPNVDVLLRERFLRKKYKDPITKGDFRLLSPLELQSAPGMTSATPGLPGARPPGLPGATPTGQGGGIVPLGPTAGQPPRSSMGANSGSEGPQGGIAAAVSRSTAASIRVFKNRRQYNQWVVTVQDVMPRAGVGVGTPTGQPGQPGVGPPGGAPGLPGRSPGSSPGFPTRQP